MEGKPVVIVSGLPRSGTSMMMRMLEAGGLEPLVDGIREADDDNPRGYFEFERVKGLPADRDWLDQARGRCVKVISGLLEHLPGDRRYLVVFMRREMREVLASQRRMLLRRGRPADASADEKMSALFEKHLASVQQMIASRPELDCLEVGYGSIVDAPAEQAATLASFLAEAADLDVAAMAAAVDGSLYRQRAR